MTTFHIKNFTRNNTPKWASQLGNIALVMGGFFASIVTTAVAVESYFSVVPSNLIDIIAYAKVIGTIGSLVCGGVKSFTKLFGIPLKDIQ